MRQKGEEDRLKEENKARKKGKIKDIFLFCKKMGQQKMKLKWIKGMVDAMSF